MAASMSIFFLLFLLPTTAVAVNTTHLRFYFHELYGKSSFIVASLNMSSFGNVRVFDDALTEGPDMSSALVGRAQGMTVEDSLGVPSMLSTMNFVFTTGEYNGSSLAIYGMWTAALAVSERTIVGGSGRFRLARGYALGQIITSNDTYLLMQWDVYV